MLYSKSLAVLAVLVIVPTAFAQKPIDQDIAARFRGPFGTIQPGLFALVSQPVVQQELGVTDEQKAKITGILEEMPLPGESIDLAKLQGLNEKEQNEYFAKQRQANSKKVTALEERLKKLLTPDQLARLDQLDVQAWGAIVVLRPDIAQAVGLSQEQKDKIRQVRKPYPQAPRYQPPRLRTTPPAELKKALDEWQSKKAEKEAEMLNVLDDEQKAKFAEFKGKEFAFPAPSAD